MNKHQGKKLWQISNPVGRPRTFKDPKKLWQDCCSYFQWVDDTPFLHLEQSRSKGSKKDKEVTAEGTCDKDTGLIEIPAIRPYTLEELTTYLGVSESYFRNFNPKPKLSDDPTAGEVQKYKKDLQLYKDFFTVITHVKQIIYSQKFSGAAVGAFNANIIARDLGLADKKEVHHRDGQTFTLNIKPKRDDS